MATLNTNVNVQITEEELNLLRVLLDPVLWARVEMNWKARSYQAEILHCQDKKIVIRAGRRMGKTDTLCIKSLHHAYTQSNKGNKEEPGYRVLYVAPYESQVNEFFSRLRELISRSSNLQASVVRDVKNPHHNIEFANGSIIRGMSAGSSSGKGAVNIRGQKADLLILDEAAYLRSTDVSTLMALQLENPKYFKVIAASTPAGGDNHFRQWCVNKDLGWKEFHFPGYLNPNWSPEMEAELREEFPGVTFDLEVLAEFTTESTTVFPRRFVEAAIGRGREIGLEYHDESFKDKKGPRVLGVDWNKYSAATNMAIVEYNTQSGLYTVIQRVEIPRSEFTLDEAVRKIISLNEVYDLDYIYVDRGYGEYQVEMLRKFGLEHPGTGLHEKVYDVSYSDVIKVPDPFTKELTSKKLKHWIINQLQLLFERGRIALPSEDRIMARQFFNYQIKSYSPNGEPVYTDTDDHIVDAIGFAIHGLLVHFSDICKIKSEFAISTTTNLITKANSKAFSGPRRKSKISAISSGPIVRRALTGGLARRRF